MIARPLPSRRVLAELVALYPVSALQVGPDGSSVHRAFAELIRLLDRQAAARQTGGRNGAVVCARDRHAHITLPLRRMPPLGLSSDAVGPRVILKPGDLRRRLRRARRHWRHGRDPRSALSAELPTAEVRALAAGFEATAASLLLAPVAGLSDLAVKVCVLIALGGAGPADGAGLPGVHLRVLLADLDRLLTSAR